MHDPVLDHPIWEALRGRQARIAEGNRDACRFPTEMTSLGAMRDLSADSFAALGALQTPGEATAIFVVRFASPPPGWSLLRSDPLPQFIHHGNPPPLPDFEPVELGRRDAAEMLALAQLTRPGPFGSRTGELGRYLGVRRQGRLVAMAGERLRPPGYTEISAVCTHPGWAGQGFAAALVSCLIAGIYERHETPILHVRYDNERAIALYRRLGFQLRARLHVAVVARPSTGDAPSA